MAEKVFQFAPDGAVSSGRLGVSSAVATLGAAGGNAVLDNAARFLEGASPDLSGGVSLPDFIDPLFAPKLAAQKKARFFEGYTAAAMGKSQAEIDAEQPWYTRIFGPVPYQLGAEKFTVDKAAADASTYFINELPRLRTMPTEDVAKELHAKAVAQVGDNPMTTMMLSKSFMDRMGPLLDLHTKARYEWEQEDMRNKQLEAVLSSAEEFEAGRAARAALGSSEPNDVKAGYNSVELTRNFIGSFIPPEMQDPASQKRYVMDAIRLFADHGKFSAIALLTGTDVEKVLDVSEREQLAAYTNAKYSEYKDKVLVADPVLHEEVVKANLAAAQGLGGAATVQQMRDIDQKFQAKTGYEPFYDPQDYVRLPTQSGNAAISNLEQAQRAAEAETRAAARESQRELIKAQGDAQAKASVRNAFVTGDNAFIDGLPIPDTDKDSVMTAVYDELEKTDPAAAARLLVLRQSMHSAPVPTLKRRFTQMLGDVTGGAWSPAFDAVYEQFNSLRAGAGTWVNKDGKVEVNNTLAGPAAARTYFGEDSYKRLEAYGRKVRAHMPRELAYAQTFGENPSERPTLQGETSEETKKIRKQLSAVVDRLTPADWRSVVGQDVSLTRSSKSLLKRWVGDEYGSLPDIADPEKRLNAAVGLVKSNGLEVHGRYAFMNPQAGETPRLASYFTNADDTSIAPAVDAAVTRELKRVGYKVSDDSDVQVIRLNDEGGQPVLTAVGFDGSQYFVTRIDKSTIEAERKRIRTSGTPEQRLKDIPLETYYTAPGMFDTR